MVNVVALLWTAEGILLPVSTVEMASRKDRLILHLPAAGTSDDQSSNIGQ